MFVKSGLKFMTVFFASFLKRGGLCLRKLAGVLLVFQVISFGLFYHHLSDAQHVHSSVTGDVIHLAPNCLSEHFHEVDTYDFGFPNADDDDCPAIGLLAHASVFAPSIRAACVPPKEIILISKEVQVHQLQIVYLSNKALYQAPKQSPPLIAG